MSSKSFQKVFNVSLSFLADFQSLSAWIIVSPVTKKGSALAFQSIIHYMLLNKYRSFGMVAGQITRQARTFTRKLRPKIVMTPSQRTQDHHQHHKKYLMSPKIDMTRWGQEDEREIIDPSFFFFTYIYLIRYCNIPEGRWRFKIRLLILKNSSYSMKRDFTFKKKKKKNQQNTLKSFWKNRKTKNKSRKSNESFDNVPGYKCRHPFIFHSFSRLLFSPSFFIFVIVNIALPTFRPR